MSDLNEALQGLTKDLGELTATFNRMGQTLQEYGTAHGPVRVRSRWSRAVPYITVVSAIVLLACILVAAL